VLNRGGDSGYARILLAAAAFAYVDDVRVFVGCYMLSAFLDVMDGYAARYLDQCTRSLMRLC
jgi:phosphatidylglycerophosphate synthase